MNLTFFIGNGFDRQCGLASDYKSVYKAYREERSNTHLGGIMCKHFDPDSKEDWSDFETGIFKNASKFENSKQLRECVEDFVMFLKQYLISQESEYLDKISISSNETFYNEIQKSVLNYYRKIYPKEEKIVSKVYENDPVIVNIISLNYTRILERMFEKTFNNANNHMFSDDRNNYYFARIVKVHGSLDDQIITGVDNADQFGEYKEVMSDDEINALTKTLLINEYDDSNANEAISILSRTNILCIFGASLGDADKTWRDRIVSWLKSNKNNQLVKVYKKDKFNYVELSSRIIEQEKEAKNEFAKELKLSEEEKELLIKQIHIPLQNELFEFQKIFDSLTRANYGSGVSL